MSSVRRKNIRLRSWDYTNTAWYFVTICCKDRRRLLGRIVDATGTPIDAIPLQDRVSIGQCTLQPSKIGQICADVLNSAKAAFPPARIKAYVIMPNHVHFIVSIRRNSRAPISLAGFVRYVKSEITKQVRRADPHADIWQRGYHDHIIRDDADFERIIEYIVNNPAKWAEDRYFT